jgi:hypothetical protein
MRRIKFKVSVVFLVRPAMCHSIGGNDLQKAVAATHASLNFTEIRCLYQ